jgi:hypothetical protein
MMEWARHVARQSFGEEDYKEETTWKFSAYIPGQ